MTTRHSRIRRLERAFAQNWLHMLRYLLVSLVVYAFVLFALYCLVAGAGARTTPAYVGVFLLAYIAEYTATVLLVFEKRPDLGSASRFVAYVLLFLGTSTILYTGIQMLGVHYLAAALIASVILMPLRFACNKLWVYR